ncbi:MAG: serine hydrolase domain-containing protein [Bacteroidota bacterium]|nr:serine hydrolase domain-containing protein [Bacteroidota bacterium]
MFRKYLVFFNILFVFLFFTDQFAQQKNYEFENYFNTYFNSRKIPSASVGVAQHGKIEWLETKGYSDIENKIPATNNSTYRIASVSKTITAVAVMQLVEKGKLRLEDNAKKYLPEFSHCKYDFTIRQLLNHTSGIRGYKEGEFDSNVHFKSFSELLRYLAKDTLQYKPGTKYLYSTLAYNLLGAIIERVTEESFAVYVKENIFKPSGMEHTLPDLSSEFIRTRAKGYDRKGSTGFIDAPLVDLSIKIPGGGFLSTSADLLKFGIALLNGKLIKRSTLEIMLKPTYLASGKKSDYGLGMVYQMDKTGNYYFHHVGGGTGFSAHLIIYPHEELVTVHLINLKTGDLGDPALDLSRIALHNKNGNYKNSSSAKK